MVNRYLARFAELAKLPTVELDSAGHADLQARIGGGGHQRARAPRCADDFRTGDGCSDHRPRGFYRTLLDMSFVATQDAAFAIDGPRDKVVLRALRRLSALDYEEFEDLVVTVGQVADISTIG